MIIYIILFTNILAIKWLAHRQLASPALYHQPQNYFLDTYAGNESYASRDKYHNHQKLIADRSAIQNTQHTKAHQNSFSFKLHSYGAEGLKYQSDNTGSNV